jgi:hypothetical protein
VLVLPNTGRLGSEAGQQVELAAIQRDEGQQEKPVGGVAAVVQPGVLAAGQTTQGPPVGGQQICVGGFVVVTVTMELVGQQSPLTSCSPVGQQPGVVMPPEVGHTLHGSKSEM